MTIDAMGCQRAIAQRLIDKGTDYVLALKGNQGPLHEEVDGFFRWVRRQPFADVPHSMPFDLCGGEAYPAALFFRYFRARQVFLC